MRDRLALRFFWVMLLVIGVLTLFAQCCFGQGSRRLMLLRAQVASGCTVATNALAVTLLDGWGNTSNASTYASASFTPAAGATLVLFAAYSPAQALGVSDTQGWTWWKAGHTNYNTLASPANTLAAWVSQVPASVTSPSSMQVTITNTSGTGCNFQLLQITGADTNKPWGTNAVVQTSLNASNATANPQVTISAPNSSGSNAVLVAFADDINSTSDNAAGSGTTEVSETAYNTPATGLASYRLLNAVAGNTLFTNIATSRDWGAAALEIRAGTNHCPAEAGSYTYTATKFDGANDYMTHSGDLTGEADSKLVTISFWLKLNDAAQNGTERMIIRDAGDKFDLYIDTDNKLKIFAQDASSTVLVMASAGTFTQSATWKHILIAFDLADTAKRFLYVNDAADSATWSTYVNSAIDFASGGDEGFMARQAGTSKVAGSLTDFYMHRTTYVDISVEANRRKFITAGIKPVDLGADGSTPTGSQPIMFFRNAFATFQNNLGSGGNFTVTGALEDDASIP